MDPSTKKMEREASDEVANEGSARLKTSSKNKSETIHVAPSHSSSTSAKRRSERSNKKKKPTDSVKKDREKEKEKELPLDQNKPRPTSSTKTVVSGKSATKTLLSSTTNLSDEEAFNSAIEKDQLSQGTNESGKDLQGRSVVRRRSENDDNKPSTLTSLPDKLNQDVAETTNRRRSRSFHIPDLKNFDPESSEDFKRFTNEMSEKLQQQMAQDNDEDSDEKGARNAVYSDEDSPVLASKFESVLPSLEKVNDKQRIQRVHARSFSESDSPRRPNNVAAAAETPEKKLPTSATAKNPTPKMAKSQTLGSSAPNTSSIHSNGNVNANVNSNSNPNPNSSMYSVNPISDDKSKNPLRVASPFPGHQEKDRRVRLNVGGQVFVTFASTLAKFPTTLLGAMFHPRNQKLLHENEDHEYFFDRDPRAFDVILNFYRTGAILAPPWLPLELLVEEARFFAIDLAGIDNGRADNKRLSMELMNMEYKNRIADAAVYKKMSRHKLLSDYHSTLVEILQVFSSRIERKAAEGHNVVDVKFFSPLHYNKATTPVVFNVISKNEIRELVVELLREKHFIVEETNEYSKIKTTNIIGLDDQVTNYNDPKYFAFSIRW